MHALPSSLSLANAATSHVLEVAMVDESSLGDVMSLTAQVVSAYVSKNPLPRTSLPELIQQIHSSLNGLRTPAAEPVAPLIPAVPIKKSVTPDYIISLEDGRKFKSMKRYLGLRNMTPDEYRQKWGLPADYPMVAPNYAATRSRLAKSIGLGRKAKVAEPTKAKTTRSKSR
jgi:predicted transcriptional regulator